MGIRYTQPQGPLQLELSSPLSAGCVGYYLPNGIGTPSGGPTRAVSIYGAGNTFVGASSQRITIPLDIPITLGNTGSTLVGIANSTDIANGQAIFSISNANDYFSCLFRGDLTSDPISVASWTASGSLFRQKTGPAFSSGVNYVVAVTTDTAGNFNLYLNGVLQSGSYSNTGSIPTAALTNLVVGATNTAAYLNGSVFGALAFNRVLSAAEIQSLSNNPWQIFKSQSRRIWVAGTGGTVWNVSISESVSLSEALSAIAGFQGNQAESLALADSQSATNVAVVSASESIPLADAPSSGVATGASISESLALAESISSSALFSASMTEAMALVEAVTSVLSAAASVAESVSLSDTPSAVAVFSASTTESVTLADTSSTSGQVTSASVAESMALSDTPSALAIFIAAVTEAVSLADNLSVAAQLSSAMNESVALLDSSSTFGQVLAASVAESISLTDSWAVTTALIRLIESLIRMDAAFRGDVWRSIDRYSRADVTHRSSVWRLEN